MSTNDFLTFAGGGSANALSQTDYAALTTILANGFSSGVLPSARLNKVLRQCAAMSSALGELIKGSGLDALDDGNAATLLSNLKTAIYDQGGRAGHAYTGNDWAFLDRNRSLIIQWGRTATVAPNGSVVVTFPITFPSSQLMGIAANSDNVPPEYYASCANWGTTGMELFVSNGNSKRYISWIAIGC